MPYPIPTMRETRLSRTFHHAVPTPSTETLDGSSDGWPNEMALRGPVPSCQSSSSTINNKAAEVMGTTQLFDGGQLRYIPMPTPSPCDPLNLPPWRKWAAIFSLSFFGALALAGEFIIGALVPVFVLEYAGIDPRILGTIHLQDFVGRGAGQGTRINLNPFALLSSLGGPPVWKVALLSSLPLLMNGLASYVLVPLAIAVGRRPVLLAVGILAWSGGLWASFSTSLDSHLAARALQGLGAGAVEALIPLIVQDIMFIHQRNRAISLISAGQGLFIVSLGIASPVIVARLGWRYIYWITAGLGTFAWFLLVAFVPETRFTRSDAELAGKPVYPLYPGETRPRLDPETYGPRTHKTDFGLFHVGVATTDWARARDAMWETIKTTFFPNVLWAIIVNSLLVSVQGAAGQVGSAVLIAAGWQFETLGLAVVPLVIASPLVWLVGGWGADRVSNWHARRPHRGGKREPEAHLLSLVFPLLCGIVGPFLFGYAGQNIVTVSTYVLLAGIFFTGFSFMTANTLFSVYLVESYPSYAGPILINVSSCRLIVGFAMSFDATSWVEQLGFLKSFGIYSGALGIAALGWPLVYFYGKRIRAFTAGKLGPTTTTTTVTTFTTTTTTVEGRRRRNHDQQQQMEARGEVLRGEK